jgi:hypothetical protein
MTFEEFIAKYIAQAVYDGYGVDTDGKYGFQCMDLMHAFVKEVLGLSYSELAAPTAAQVYKNYPYVPGSEKFIQIPNTPTGIPQKNDIVFFSNYDPIFKWNNLYGVDGHVCMIYKADMNNMCTFDQNYPTGSLPRLYKHSYRGCLGWLRKR